MKRNEYFEIERYMLEKMSDSAHDRLHVYRVLYLALDISAHERGADTDVLVAAALLHDVGRAEQLRNLELDHAEIGAAMAYAFLTARGWDESAAAHVRDCVFSHRYRRERPPATLEAKILFDADKLEAAGVTGISRTLIYAGSIGEPLYNIRDGEPVTEGERVEAQSFVQEYNFKLRNIYDSFHTARARELAEVRRAAAEAFYAALMREINESHGEGPRLLDEILE